MSLEVGFEVSSRQTTLSSLPPTQPPLSAAYDQDKAFSYCPSAMPACRHASHHDGQGLPL